jgi:hypothetical protein
LNAVLWPKPRKRFLRPLRTLWATPSRRMLRTGRRTAAGGSTTATTKQERERECFLSERNSA